MSPENLKISDAKYYKVLYCGLNPDYAVGFFHGYSFRFVFEFGLKRKTGCPEAYGLCWQPD